MNVSIPDKLKGWAESRVAEGRYSSTSDYVRDLVRRDQEREEARRRLQAAIDEGVPTPVLSAALFERFTSRGEADFANQLLCAMRHSFGGHLEKPAKEAP